MNKVREQIDFLKSGKSTVATMFKLEPVKNDHDELNFKPVFVYRTPSGKSFIYTDYPADRPATWQLGNKVRVVYNPINPHQAKVLTVSEVFGFSALLLGLAIVLLFIGGGYIWAKQFLASLP